MTIQKLLYFKNGADFRRWLEKHHLKEKELWVGFYKKHSGRSGISYQESVDEALCFGWIDGLKKRVDDLSYCHRFTPRKKDSTWSRVNIVRTKQLIEQGLVVKAGLDAFALHEKNLGNYSYEERPRELDAKYTKQLAAEPEVNAFIKDKLPAGYKRTAVFWVMSAVKEETRDRRFQQYMEACRKGERLPHLTGKKAE